MMTGSSSQTKFLPRIKGDLVSPSHSPGIPQLLSSPRWEVWLAAILITFVGLHILQRAWLCDDGLITFRSALNLAHGNGFTYNVTERVQSYTNPLFLLSVTLLYFLTGEIFYTTLFWSILLSLASLYVICFRYPQRSPWVVFGLTGLLISKCFIEWSTGGLENPMAHLLVVFVPLAYFHQKEKDGPSFMVVALLCSLVFVNRMDHILLVLPLALASIWKCREWRKILGWGLLGSLPALGWLAFSTIYYGFPFPNTAYAKLGAWLESSYYVQRGWNYFLDSLYRDPVTLPLMGLVLALGIWTRKTIPILIAAGILVYSIYTVRVGGDFMTGRFFSTSLVFSCSILPFLPWKRLISWAPATAGLLLIGMALGNVPFDLPDAKPSKYGPNDTRWHYKTRYGWSLDSEEVSFPDVSHWKQIGRFSHAGQAQKYIVDAAIMGSAGESGLVTGPEFYLIDYLALTDPLLARLPTLNPRIYGFPRIGHLVRAIPAGYVKTRQTGAIDIADPKVADFYHRLRKITAGPVWNWNRFANMWYMNRGKYDYLLNKDGYRSPENFHPEYVDFFYNLREEKESPRPWQTWVMTYLDAVAQSKGNMGNNRNFSTIFQRAYKRNMGLCLTLIMRR